MPSRRGSKFVFTLYRTLSLRYLRLRWGLNALVILSIALGVIVWVATATLYHSLESSILVSVNPLAGMADLMVSNGDAGVSRSLEKQLAAIPGIREVRPMLVEPVRVVIAEGQREPAMLLGVDVRPGSGSGAVFGDVRFTPGTEVQFLAAKVMKQQPAILGQTLDARLPAGTRKVKLVAAGKTHEVTRVGAIEASGVLSALGGHILLMECDLAAQLVDRPGRVSRLDVVLEPGADAAVVTSGVRALLSEGAEGDVRTPQDENNRVREALAPVKVGSLIVSTGALVVGMFLVFNTLSVSVAERRHDIGVLRSVGATRDQIRRLFQGEALLLGLLGSVLGIPLGLGLAYLLQGRVGQMVVDALGTTPMKVPPLEELLPLLVIALCSGVATSVVASVIPAIRAAREEPADAVRRVPPSGGFSARALQLAACLTLLVLGLALVASKDALPVKRMGVFAGIGCIFLSAFLAIALFSAVCARLLRPLAQRLLPVEGRLAADNLVRSPGRTGLVIAALAACVALMAHTAGIIQSNETAVLGWLDRAVTADLIITAGGPISSTGQTMAMRNDVLHDLEKELPGSKLVPISWRYLEWPRLVDDLPLVVAAIDAAAYYAANHERGSSVPHLDLFRRLATERGTTIVSDNFAALYRVKVGDVVTLRGVDGPLPLQVIGSVEDYSAPRGLLYVHRDHYLREMNIRVVDVLDVYLSGHPDTVEVESARAKLAQSSVAAEYALVPMTGREVRQEILDMIRRIHSLAYLQEIVVGLVAALGVVAALMISVIQRRRELGLLRAVGATRGQILKTVLFEALLMGIIGSALGVFFGLLLEWYAVRVILLEESGFRFPVVAPWGEAGFIAAVAVTAATLAGLMPALRAIRLRIADAIAYE